MICGLHIAKEYYRLVEQENQIYIENYSQRDPILYAGAARELDILKTIAHDSIERHYHCSMVSQKDGEMFRGGVEPGNFCVIEKNVCPTYFQTHEQVWGSKHGPLCFEKVQSFADEVPMMN